ncbi:MAG: fructosamine kinase, partial [Magnetovibrio sp.]|nr:fructosamine kinase [Magnetovibrio sp.]
MDLAARIKAVTGHAPERVRALSGGCVGDVYRITMPAGPDLVAKVGVEGSGLKCE